MWCVKMVSILELSKAPSNTLLPCRLNQHSTVWLSWFFSLSSLTIITLELYKAYISIGECVCVCGCVRKSRHFSNESYSEEKNYKCGRIHSKFQEMREKLYVLSCKVRGLGGLAVGSDNGVLLCIQRAICFHHKIDLVINHLVIDFGASR